jgi:hypothetical protein
MAKNIIETAAVLEKALIISDRLDWHAYNLKDETVKKANEDLGRMLKQEATTYNIGKLMTILPIYEALADKLEKESNG